MLQRSAKPPENTQSSFPGQETVSQLMQMASLLPVTFTYGWEGELAVTPDWTS